MEKIKNWSNFINESDSPTTVEIGDKIFTISDEKIEDGDYFIELDRGRLMPYICNLDNDPDAHDHMFGDVEVVVMNRGAFEWNNDMTEYKKIIDWKSNKS